MPLASWRCTWLSVLRAPMAPPADRVGDILRTGRFEELGGRGHARAKHIEQGASGEQQPFLNVVRAVDVRVVDQPLPSHRGARFLEVHAHDDEQVLPEFILERAQTVRIVERGLRVVYRARAHDHQQTVVLAVQAGAHLVSRIGDDVLHLPGERQFREHLRRCGQRVEFEHASVDDAVHAGHVFPSGHILEHHQRILACGDGVLHLAHLLMRVGEAVPLHYGVLLLLGHRLVRILAHVPPHCATI